MTDLMAWNADATRLPYRMHTEYLRQLFLDNDLAEGRFLIAGKPVALTDIKVPLFAVGTVQDHVAPWRSTYKIHLQTDTEVTYLLTSGGHNAGIISELDHAGRHYVMRTKRVEDHYLDPDSFAAEAIPKEGSWWPPWVAWLIERSGKLAEAAPQPLQGLCEAPGTYVLER
jgi:polyhydroxyalkanoate synthase